MQVVCLNKFIIKLLILLTTIFLVSSTVYAESSNSSKKGAPPVPVKIAPVEEKSVSDQISLIGTAAAIATSTVAAEVSGLVEGFPVKAGNFVKEGQLLARLNEREIRLRLKSYVADRERVKANLENAEKELKRLSKLREANSIAETIFDVAHYAHQALLKALMKSNAEIEHLNYEIERKKIYAPFSGFIAEEHTEIGEWIKEGGPVVTLVNMAQVLVTVDVPERFVVKLSPEKPVQVLIKSVSAKRLSGSIYAILPQGDSKARTIPVRVNIKNPDLKIRAGMEAMVTFDLQNSKKALLVPKDAVVTSGRNRSVYVVTDNKATPVDVQILGYHNSSVAVTGKLKPGDKVVIRGNERLRPGQAVRIISNESN